MAGDVTDHHCEPVRAGREDVVKVACHHPAAGFVNPTDVEAFVSRKGFWGEAGCPPAGSQLVLGEDLLGPSFEPGALLGQPGL